MDINQKIKIILKEADLYHNQGLLSEAELKYREILILLQKHLNLENSEKIKKAIEKRIRDLDQEKKRVEKKVMSPHMTKESQDLITQMFVSADGKESSAAKLEGAKALIKFGQFERAVVELMPLINDESVKLEASKQIITCLVLNSKEDDGIQQINEWISSDFLGHQELKSIIKHITELFRTRGIDKEIPNIAPNKEEIKTPVPIESTETDNNLMFKKDSFFFEEDFEEYDILSSAKKTDKTGKKKP